MPSESLRRWTTIRSQALDEMAQAHRSVGGKRPGRRFATQQINRAYAVLLSSQFQGFCRDLHTECVSHLVSARIHTSIQKIIEADLTRHRQLDKGNAQPGSIGSDFGRLGIDFWAKVDAYQARNRDRRLALIALNEWRNAIVHHDFDAGKLGGTTSLRLSQVDEWRRACHSLAQSFDEVMRSHLESLCGMSPW
jgi:hypothetical protein